jgi:para-nitrobenzyl esterase
LDATPERAQGRGLSRAASGVSTKAEQSMKINQFRSRVTGAVVAVGLVGAGFMAGGIVPAGAVNHGAGQAAAHRSTAPVTKPAFAAVSGGKVMGARVDGVYEFKGVPYATAGRFEESKPASWNGVKKTLAYGEVCPNGAVTVNPHEFVTTSGQDLVENEQCLNLNVWSTTNQPVAKKKQKPVIVWMHGGGFSSGSSAELPYYNGHNLADQQDVVFVSVNHRLNVLGYLDLSSYGPQYAKSGNLGQLDLVAALQWVKANAAQFGGDASNVTIMGQSGGAGKVMTLLGMPSAQGLFSKAVVMSGGSSGIPQADARAKTDQVLASLGVTTVDELKAVPYAELAAAASAARFSPSPVIDGDVYPAPTIKDGVFSPLAKDIPILASNTFGEVVGNSVPLTSWNLSENPLKDAYRPDTSPAEVRALLRERFGSDTSAIIREFQRAYPTHDLFDLLFMSAGNGPSRLPVVDAKAAQGGAPVYSALYAWNLPFFGGVVSVHTGGDLPFIFGNPQTIPDLIAGDEDGAYKLAKEASSSLGAFAHTGNPAVKHGLAWPAYTAKAQWTMVFDEKSKAKVAPDRKIIDMVIAAR